MDTYLTTCGIILNIAIILLVVGVIITIPIDKIQAKKRAKKRRAEEAEKQKRFKKELELVKPKWAEWTKELARLKEATQKENDPGKRLRLRMDTAGHRSNGFHFFPSINKWIHFSELEEKDEEKLEKDSANEQEKGVC